MPLLTFSATKLKDVDLLWLNVEQPIRLVDFYHILIARRRRSARNRKNVGLQVLILTNRSVCHPILD